MYFWCCDIRFVSIEDLALHYVHTVTIDTSVPYDNYSIIVRARTQKGLGNGVMSLVFTRSFPGGIIFYF